MVQIVLCQWWQKMEEFGMNTNFYTFTNQKTLIEDFSKTIIDKLEKAIEKKVKQFYLYQVEILQNLF